VHRKEYSPREDNSVHASHELSIVIPVLNDTEATATAADVHPSESEVDIVGRSTAASQTIG
jgi:hypothetical protein